MFPLGRLTIFGGRPFVGKTSFILSIARVLNAGLLYISLKEEAFKVIDAVRLQEQRKKFLKRWAFNICDIPGISVEEVECLIKNRYHTIIINYVELMNLHNNESNKNINRKEELRKIYERLDFLAKKYNRRIIGVSMLGRFENPEVPRFEECINSLNPVFRNERLIIIRDISKYGHKQPKTTTYIELLYKNLLGEEFVDRISVDKKTKSIIRLVSSKRRQLK